MAGQKYPPFPKNSMVCALPLNLGFSLSIKVGALEFTEADFINTENAFGTLLLLFSACPGIRSILNVIVTYFNDVSKSYKTSMSSSLSGENASPFGEEAMSIVTSFWNLSKVLSGRSSLLIESTTRSIKSSHLDFKAILLIAFLARTVFCFPFSFITEMEKTASSGLVAILLCFEIILGLVTEVGTDAIQEILIKKNLIDSA
jgi:hypothetical protein